MAKKSWTKSLKALFGKSTEGSEESHEGEEKKKREVWEKEDDDGAVWAYFPVHEEEEKEEAEKNKDDKETVEESLDDILVEKETEETKVAEEKPLKEEPEADKSKVWEEHYLEDEIIYQEKSSSVKDASVQDKTHEEKIALEEEAINKILSPSDEFIEALKRGYVKYIKHKYPFKDFTYLEKELRKGHEEEEETERDEAVSAPASAFEKVFIEMQEHMEVGEGAAKIATEEDNYSQFKFSTTNILTEKKEDEKTEDLSSGQGKALWEETKYGDFFSSPEQPPDDRRPDETIEESSEADSFQGDKSKKKRNRFADIVSSVKQDKSSMGSTEKESSIPLLPPLQKEIVPELSEEDEKLDPDDLVIQANKELELGWKDKGINLLKKAALIYNKHNELTKASTIYQKLHVFDPTNISYIYALGFICKELDKTAEAKIHFRNVLKIELTHKDTLFQLGLISLEENSDDTALIAFRKVITLDPYHKEAYEKLGELLIKKGDNKEAINTYLKGSQQFLLKKERDNSIDLLKKVISIDPQNEEARKNLEDLGFDPDMATSEIEESVKDLTTEPSPEEIEPDLNNKFEEPERSLNFATKDLEVETEKLTSAADEIKLGSEKVNTDIYEWEPEDDKVELDKMELESEKLKTDVYEWEPEDDKPETEIDKIELKDDEVEQEDDEVEQEDDEVEQEDDEVDVPNNSNKKDFDKIMNLSVKFEPNLDDFIEEISVEGTLNPALEKVLKQYIDEFALPSPGDDISAEVLFSLFMEEFIDDFDRDMAYNQEDYSKYSKSLYSNFNKIFDAKATARLKDKVKDFRAKPKISPEIEKSEDIKSVLPAPEIKAAETEEKEPKPSETSEMDISGSIYESLSEEFVEDFMKGDLKPYDEGEAFSVGLGITMEEEEEEEEEEIPSEPITADEEEEIPSYPITADEEIEEIAETRQMETREIELTEIDLEKPEEIQEMEETETRQMETREIEVTESDLEKPEEIQEIEKVEEVIAEESQEPEEIQDIEKDEGFDEIIKEKREKGEIMPEIDKEINRCKNITKKHADKIDDVIRVYQKLSREYPSYSPLCCAIGSLYIKKGLFIEGVKEFIKTIDIKALEGKDNFLKNLNK